MGEVATPRHDTAERTLWPLSCGRAGGNFSQSVKNRARAQLSVLGSRRSESFQTKLKTFLVSASKTCVVSHQDIHLEEFSHSMSRARQITKLITCRLKVGRIEVLGLKLDPALPQPLHLTATPFKSVCDGHLERVFPALHSVVAFQGG